MVRTGPGKDDTTYVDPRIAEREKEGELVREVLRQHRGMRMGGTN